MFKKFIEKVEGTTLKMSGDNINQTQRNELKADTNKAVQELLTEQGLNAHVVNGGVAFEIRTETGQKFKVVMDAVIKNKNFNIADEIAEYEQVMAERAERERKKAEKKAEIEKERNA